MEEQAHSFDVCIVCALPEEARAFLEILRADGEIDVEERLSSRFGYDYRFATIKNDKDETLRLHVSWLPRYGPQEMTLHLVKVLEECQPRIAIMTGICAGDPEKVQLGDLVVAERTFTYDNGKFTLDEQGRNVHEHDTITYQLDANILQFLGMFDDWKPLVARLERPTTPPKIILKRSTVSCHIKAMASGSAVRSDHPFQDVRAPVRGTVAIDMEGAAFGLVMSRHPLIPWLIAKGVCDYADSEKDDSYHHFTAQASAIYALRFIRAYVTSDRLPPRTGSSPSSLRERLQGQGFNSVPNQANAETNPRGSISDSSPYEHDFRKLKALSQAELQRKVSHTRIPLPTMPLVFYRACLDEALAAAQHKGFLLAGEPGIGKTGFLVQLCQALGATNRDVVFLSAAKI